MSSYLSPEFWIICLTIIVKQTHFYVKGELLGEQCDQKELNQELNSGNLLLLSNDTAIDMTLLILMISLLYSDTDNDMILLIPPVIHVCSICLLSSVHFQVSPIGYLY